MNHMLSKHKETSKRFLNFTVPRVVAVSPQMRLVEDNPSSVSLLDIYKNSCQKQVRKISSNYQLQLLSENFKLSLTIFFEETVLAVNSKFKPHSFRALTTIIPLQDTMSDWPPCRPEVAKPASKFLGKSSKRFKTEWYQKICSKIGPTKLSPQQPITGRSEKCSLYN